MSDWLWIVLVLGGCFASGLIGTWIAERRWARRRGIEPRMCYGGCALPHWSDLAEGALWTCSRCGQMYRRVGMSKWITTDKLSEMERSLKDDR